MGFLTGKKLLITGLLSNRSIAYGIAKACHEQGAELAFSYVGERFKDRITEFAAEFGSNLVFECDVGSDESVARLFSDLSQTWPKFDGFVHSIGFAPREAIAGKFLDGMTRDNFQTALDISAYSFPAMTKAALPYLNDKSSVLTLTYLGAVRNDIVHTLAGSGRNYPYGTPRPANRCEPTLNLGCNTIYFDSKERQETHELRLGSSEGAFKWVAGLYYFEERNNVFANVFPAVAFIQPNTYADSKAAFFQGTIGQFMAYNAFGQGQAVQPSSSGSGYQPIPNQPPAPPPGTTTVAPHLEPVQIFV